jgi:hypothetical protein
MEGCSTRIRRYYRYYIEVINDDELDEEFPLGDGTAETSAEVVCPYCGEPAAISVDPGGGSFQQYVEDCEVCCNPWQVSVRFVDGAAMVDVLPLDS